MRKMKRTTRVLFIAVILLTNAVCAAPVLNNTMITQVINTEVIFNSGMFTENIEDLDGGAFSGISITDLPLIASGALESVSDTIVQGASIPAANISNLKFVPAEDFTGMTSFTYRINNGTELSNEATFTIDYVNMLSNTPPTVQNLELTILKNEPETIMLPATDEDDDTLTYTIITEPANGSLDKTSIAEGIVIYTPTIDYTGTDTFTFTTNDGQVDSSTATVTINIVNELPNTPPVAADISVTTDEGTAKSITLIVTDEENDTIAYTITADPSHGTLDLTAIGTGTVIYTPNSGYTGTDFFSYKANDGRADSNIATVTITIEEVINLPAFVYEDLKTHWVNYSAGHLADRGSIIGEQIGSRYFFYPEIKMTRWEFLNYIIGALDLETATPNMELTAIYEDSQYLPEYINKIAAIATQAGFLNGVEADGKLYIQPYTYLTRAEAITLIGNLIADGVESENTLTFADKADIPDWALTQIINMKNYGIIKGYDDGTIRPQSTLTKAQTIEILYQTVKYNDNESAVFRMIKNKIS